MKTLLGFNMSVFEPRLCGSTGSGSAFCRAEVDEVSVASHLTGARSETTRRLGEGGSLSGLALPRGHALIH